MPLNTGSIPSIYSILVAQDNDGNKVYARYDRPLDDSDTVLYRWRIVNWSEVKGTVRLV